MKILSSRTSTMKITSSILLFSFLFLSVIDAQNPPPAKPQQEPILIMNATAHLGNGTVIPNAAIGFENGKLTLVADATRIRIDKNHYTRVIDGVGKHIYPGIIACNTLLGISEIDAVRSTRDVYEVGDFNPNVRTIIAYSTDSKIIPTLRSNGILLAQVIPLGGTIPGQSSVVELDGWNWEDAAYKMDDGVQLYWPRMYIPKTNEPDKDEQQRQRMMQQIDAIEAFLKEAKSYSMEKSPAEKNLKLEAMKGLFDGKKKLYVHCGFAKEIIAAVNMSKKYGIDMVLVEGYDAWRVADFLHANNIAVILNRIHSLPPREDDDVDLPYRIPAILKQAGVVYTMSMGGSWPNRNVMFNAGTSAAYGLTKEEALTSITLNPAKILGIDSTVGSLEVGKDATLFISSGDILDMKTCNVETAFIRGKDINLDNVQKQLYRKYMDRYGLK